MKYCKVCNTELSANRKSDICPTCQDQWDCYYKDEIGKEYEEAIRNVIQFTEDDVL